jgi:NAD(P)H-flavin reductase
MPPSGLPRNFIWRPTSGLFVVIGASAAGGYVYRKYISSTESHDQALNPYNFTPYTIVSKEAVSSSSSIFTLQSKQCSESSSQTIKEIWRKGVWSVEAKQPQLQIARSYTPLPTTSDGQFGDELRILIRREEGGEVSNYLHNLPANATVNLRGPHLEFGIPENVTEVLFLAGGTGIAPALQVAKLLAQRSGTKMHILWANRKREDCIGGQNDAKSSAVTGQSNGWRSLFGFEKSVVEQTVSDVPSPKALIVQELDRLKNGNDHNDLEVAYFVDEEGRYIKPDDISRLLGSTTSNDSTKKLILISGPAGFVAHWAGEKVWTAGQEAQGPLGGVLAQLKLQGWKVWKL